MIFENGKNWGETHPNWTEVQLYTRERLKEPGVAAVMVSRVENNGNSQ